MSTPKYWKNTWSNVSKQKPNPFAVRAYQLMKKQNVKTVLDLGCGDGRDAIYFAQQGLDVTAVDFSASGIQKLKSKNLTIQTMQGDIRKLQFPENSFDVIYAHLSLHYFDDATTDAIIARLHKTLKPNGLLFVKCKSVDDVLFGKGKKIGENMYEHGHVRHFFSKEYMAEKLQAFNILRLRRNSSVYDNAKSSLRSQF